MLIPFLLALVPVTAPTPPHSSDRCYVSEVHNGIPVRVYQGDRECVALAPPAEITGVWLNEFEGSVFHENAVNLTEVKAGKSEVWFSMDSQTQLPADFRRQYGHAYRMTLIGRKAVDMHREPLDGYGHMGMSPGLIVADRILRMEDLGPIRSASSAPAPAATARA
jgi:hypothetical protein